MPSIFALLDDSCDSLSASAFFAAELDRPQR